MNRYVPQSVMTPEGEVLDIHIVLNEMFKSGDKLFVEYSDGPIAYKARWASDNASLLAKLTTTHRCCTLKACILLPVKLLHCHVANMLSCRYSSTSSACARATISNFAAAYHHEHAHLCCNMHQSHRSFDWNISKSSIVAVCTWPRQL